MTITLDSGVLKENLEKVKARLKKACLKANRDESEVNLLPVSKTKPNEIIRKAFDIGITRVGENRVQEAQAKAEALEDLPLRWCIIGHLQTNKAKYVARFASELHSLDNLKLAKELEKHLQVQGKSLEVLIQVNTSEENQKYGIEPSQAITFAKELAHFDCLKVKGLMTLALFSAKEEEVRPCFKTLKNLQSKLQQEVPNLSNWGVLSMGMSGDFEIAIEEGSTEIRVGEAIFGQRNTPDFYYWPKPTEPTSIL